MSKALEALDDLRNVKGWNDNEFNKRLDTIEKSLKDYEVHEQILNDYGLNLCNFREACLLLAMLKGSGRNIHDIDKKLEALEIIKETWNITFFDEEQMITIDNCYSITFKNKDKYDLLKELVNGKSTKKKEGN